VVVNVEIPVILQVPGHSKTYYTGSIDRKILPLRYYDFMAITCNFNTSIASDKVDCACNYGISPFFEPNFADVLILTGQRASIIAIYTTINAGNSLKLWRLIYPSII
jgi:hypothetical protein